MEANVTEKLRSKIRTVKFIWKRKKVFKWQEKIEWKMKHCGMKYTQFHQRYCMSKKIWVYVTPRVANLTEEKSLCVQRHLRYGYSGSCLMLRMEYYQWRNDLRNYLTMTSLQRCFRQSLRNLQNTALRWRNDNDMNILFYAQLRNSYTFLLFT
jgi:hypothetical protein